MAVMKFPRDKAIGLGTQLLWPFLSEQTKRAVSEDLSVIGLDEPEVVEIGKPDPAPAVAAAAPSITVTQPAPKQAGAPSHASVTTPLVAPSTPQVGPATQQVATSAATVPTKPTKVNELDCDTIIEEPTGPRYCERAAVARYTWPGVAPTLACQPHLSLKEHHATACGLTLKVELLKPVDEDKPCPTCKAVCMMMWFKVGPANEAKKISGYEKRWTCPQHGRFMSVPAGEGGAELLLWDNLPKEKKS